MGICPCQTNWQTGDYHNGDCPESKKLRDSWCTPAELAALLPEVDLDPATNPRSLIKAKRHIVWAYSEEADGCYHRNLRGESQWEPNDGLSIPWNGSIFLNGPYSNMLPWCQKTNEEWGAGRLHEAIFLVKLDPTTRWWAQLVGKRNDQNTQVWLPRKRLQHIPPPRIRSSTNNFASAIVHWRRPMRTCGPWQLPLAPLADLWT